MNAHLEDDIFDDHRPPPSSRRERRVHGPTPKRGRTVVAVVIAAVLVLAAVVFAFGSLRSLIPSGGEDYADYEGPGSGQVEVTVEEGQSGSDIASTLTDAGVVASAGAFIQEANADPDKAAKIQPGVYQLKEEMKASDAFAWLADNANRIADGLTIQEGLWRSEIYQKLSESTEIPVEDYESAESSDELELPAEADGKVEGWLFPSTYEFEKDATAVQQLNTMIGKTVEELEKIGLPRENWERTLTVASIVEGESGAADRGKVARVVENRLEQTDGPTVGKLQMDSTVHYIYQERGKAGTTDEMRADQSPYNTYVHQGLPPGPINNPGAAAIEAAADPEEGDWLFFVTVDPSTGETKFTASPEEHEQNRQEFEQWCSENQDSC